MNPNRRNRFFAFASPLAILVGCSSASSPHAITPEAGAPTPKCQSFSPSSGESAIAGAIATTKDGDCIDFAAGTYKFDNQLAFGTGNGVTVSGAGIGKTVKHAIDFYVPSLDGRLVALGAVDADCARRVSHPRGCAFVLDDVGLALDSHYAALHLEAELIRTNLRFGQLDANAGINLRIRQLD